MKIKKVIIEMDDGNRLTLEDPDFFIKDFNGYEILIDLEFARTSEGKDSIIFS
jgi:hypothetical protein